MQAVAVFPKERAVKLIDHPEPKIASSTQVKLRMLEVGICGTDHEIVTFKYGTPPEGEDYLILGHESLGEVVEVGEKVTRFKPGDLGVWMVRRPCPVAGCRACRVGRPDFCFTGQYKERGIKQLHGFMTEYVVDEESYLNLVPPGLREIAVLTEPLTIAEKAMIQVHDVQDRLPWGCDIDLFPGQESGGEKKPAEAGHYCHRAVVLGGGPVGLLGAMAIVASGFETTVYSREEEPSPKAEIARALGATYLSSKKVSPEALAQQVGNIDLVYEATGAAAIAFEVLEYLGTNGVFIFTGVPGRREPIQLPAGTIMRNMVLRNQIIYGTVNAGRAAFEHAITDLSQFVGRWPAAVRSLITQHYRVEDFKTPLLEPPPGIKMVISLGK